MLSQAVHIRVDQERHHCPHANSDEDRDGRAFVYKRQCWCARAAEKKQCQSRGAQPEDCGRIRLPHQWNQWGQPDRSEEHTSELQSLMRISYAVFCLKKKKNKNSQTT